MAFEEFGAFLSEIISHTVVAAERPLVWTAIANPRAGGFTIRSRWKKHRLCLEALAREAGKIPRRENIELSAAARREGEAAASGLIPTRAKGHAGEVTAALIEEAAASASAPVTPGKRPFNLIITAGGDGTSLEVMTALYHAPADIRKDFAVLRLPLGTGNDGADSPDLDKALELLIKPVEQTYQRALRLVTASGKGPFLAFNILSAGLDAFVTHMTNRMKGRFPGDSYKLWVDIASLLYDRLYKVGFTDVLASDEKGNPVKAFRERILLLAVGESGRRTYGSRKRILPDDRNVCAIRQMPLLRKLALKGDFNYGTHVDKPEAMLWNARRIEFSSQYPVLAQMDGETVLLKEEDFPAVIELTDPVIPILKKKAELR